MVALVAAARKLLTWAWSVLRRQALFDAARIAPASSTGTDSDARASACLPVA